MYKYSYVRVYIGNILGVYVKRKNERNKETKGKRRYEEKVASERGRKGG